MNHSRILRAKKKKEKKVARTRFKQVLEKKSKTGSDCSEIKY